jgi:hypothetical protein
MAFMALTTPFHIARRVLFGFLAILSIVCLGMSAFVVSGIHDAITGISLAASVITLVVLIAVCAPFFLQHFARAQVHLSERRLNQVDETPPSPS